MTSKSTGCRIDTIMPSQLTGPADKRRVIISAIFEAARKTSKGEKTPLSPLALLEMAIRQNVLKPGAVAKIEGGLIRLIDRINK